MTRRDLLRMLLAAPIAATLDVEKLLWVPKPIITVPEISPTIFASEFDWGGPPYGRSALQDILDMIDKLKADRKYGPYVLTVIQNPIPDELNKLGVV